MGTVHPSQAPGAGVPGRVDVLIPIYRTELTQSEAFAVDQSVRVLGHYGVCFFGPRGLDVSYYAARYPGARFSFFEPEYFTSVNDYSRLLLREDFYQGQSVSEFMLIVQPDVYVFRDELARWLAAPFDYVGAPWPDGIEINIAVGKFAAVGGKPVKVYVGNGGFSLRRRHKCAALLREHAEIAEWFIKTGSSEDLFFAFMGALSSDFVMPNQMTAAAFSWELRPEHYHALMGGVLPMGAHAYEKHSPGFWVKYLAERGQ